MHILSEHPLEVELQDYEFWASTSFERYLDKGLNIPDAVSRISKAYPGLSRQFLDYLEGK